MLDEVALAQRAAQMRSTDAEARVNQFTVRLAAVRERGGDAASVAAAASQRLLTELNAAAEYEAPRLAGELHSRIGRLLDDELGTARPAEIERRGRERLSQLTVAAAEVWRQTQEERLEDGLSSLDAQLTGQLAAELDAVRDAAAELLGLEMVLPTPGGRLAPDRRFFYSVAENLDQAELLAGAVRRRLPGQLGRRLSRDHVLSQVHDLAGRHIGRARGDLQYCLAEATRQLVLAIGRRSRACTDRLAGALETAAVLRAQTADEASPASASWPAENRHCAACSPGWTPFSGTRRIATRPTHPRAEHRTAEWRPPQRRSYDRRAERSADLRLRRSIQHNGDRR